eukprot:3363172-Amphidinium_carterae.1
MGLRQKSAALPKRRAHTRAALPAAAGHPQVLQQGVLKNRRCVPRLYYRALMMVPRGRLFVEVCCGRPQLCKYMAALG